MIMRARTLGRTQFIKPECRVQAPCVYGVGYDDTEPVPADQGGYVHVEASVYDTVTTSYHALSESLSASDALSLRDLFTPLQQRN